MFQGRLGKKYKTNIDKTGAVVIPCKWKDADSFSEGLARVKDENGTEFYIDKAGNLVSPKS